MKKTIFILILLVLPTSVYALTKGVSIANWQYEPVNLTIGTGMTVIWSNNEESSTHRVLIRELSISSQLLFPGDKFNYTFTKEGKYEFYDSASPARLKGNIFVIPAEEYTYCGDGICNEDKPICCTDCGCDLEYYCFNNVCVKNETKQTKESETTGNVTKENKEEPVEETRPTNYTPLIFGSITLVALLFIGIILRAIVKKK